MQPLESREPQNPQEQPITKPSAAPSQAPASSESDSTAVVKVTNGWKTEKEGFIYVSVKGNAKERGLAHGELLADRIIKFIETYAYYVYDDTGYTIHFFIEMMADFFMSQSSLDPKYQEFVEEIEGIAAGVVKAVQEGKITDKTKSNIISASSTEPPRIKLTPESFYSAPGSTPSTDKSSVAIDTKAIFLLNGIVSLFYIFPHLEKLLDTPEYSKLKEKPVYAEFLSNASYKFVAADAVSKDSSSTPTSTSTSTPLKEEEPSLLQKLFKMGSGSDKCSAFMAIGEEYTKDGQIVCAHITFDDFMSGQFDNIILNLQTSPPGTPSPISADMLMQTFPGGIFSSTDFFTTSFGFIGTETTIGGFNSFELKAPICFRARKAMQYAKTLDDYVTYLTEHNSGDYANTWYIGRVKKTEADPPEQIMRLELGRRFVKKEVISKGYFIGFNACYDPRIRNIECSNDGFYDSRRHQGARRIRFEEIMLECIARGVKIDEGIAIKIISDHKDVYLDKDNNPCSRTICAHYDEDKREYMSDPSRPKPNQPHGAVDAKVGSSQLFKNNRFLAIFGRACGAPFNAKEFCKKHIQWANQEKYLEDRPSTSWVECNCVLVDNEANASTALKKYKDSVYTSKDSNIFSAGGVASSSVESSPSSSRPPSPTLGPLPVQSPSVVSESAPGTAASGASAQALITKPLSETQQLQQPQRQEQRDDFDDFDGGKYNKKDMKLFMKMLKSKNKKSTKQVTKNRNTKKNNHL
jgi:hypothetical protein